MEKYSINYLGKTFNTVIKKEITDEEYKSVADEYYRKPDKELVEKQIKKIHYDNGVRTNYIMDYYMKDLISKVKLHYCRWSIEEVLQYKPLVEYFAGKANNNKKVFPDTMPLVKKIETCFRLCGIHVAVKPANFPIKAADEIISKYNVNNNIYDFSCGWGIRMLSALRNGCNYYGTDPNYILCDRLQELYETYSTITGIDNEVEIMSHGSEIFIPHLENKIGLAFSSPPYYNLEDYVIGDQSYKDGVSYEEWKCNYLIPTISNIYTYLIQDGYFAINVNNFNNYNDYDLIGDTIKISQDCGFVLVNIVPLKNTTRCYGNKSWNPGDCGFYDNDEKIFVFQKQ